MQDHMRPDDVVKYIDYGVIVTAGGLAVLAAFGAIYAWPWSKFAPKQGGSTEYNSIWGVRVCLQMTAFFWLLSPLLQRHEAWGQKVDVLEQLDVSGSVPCELYLSARLGLFEPFFLFLGLLAFRHSLRQGEGWEVLNDTEMGETKAREEYVNRKIIGSALLHTLPIFGLQTLIAVLTVVVSADMERKWGFPKYFLISSVVEKEGCDIGKEGELPSSGCVVCIYPLISTMVSALFILYYLWRMWQITSQMMFITLNQSLKQRIVMFRLAVTLLLSLGVLCRGLTVIPMPRSQPFEFLRLGDFVSVALFVVASSYFLVVRPVRDTRFADKTAGMMIALTTRFSSRRLRVRRRSPS
ncbi:hypothetical protein BSKO_08591 [Bryopsis sp. KO-2023]|nr:hypothetical protein BSKO_08591 [Bryopsis sp. KO-2023]